MKKIVFSTHLMCLFLYNVAQAQNPDTGDVETIETLDEIVNLKDASLKVVDDRTGKYLRVNGVSTYFNDADTYVNAEGETIQKPHPRLVLQDMEKVEFLRRVEVVITKALKSVFQSEEEARAHAQEELDKMNAQEAEEAETSTADEPTQEEVSFQITSAPVQEEALNAVTAYAETPATEESAQEEKPKKGKK